MSIAPDSKTPLTPAIPAEMMRLPVGAASPLWGLFAGAAVTGAAWWWMTRWARPENLEAMLGHAVKTTETVVEAVETEVAALPDAVVEPPAALEVAPIPSEPVVEAAAEVAEAIAEPVAAAVEAAPELAVETAEAVTEAPETVAEALMAAPEEVAEPVGGESAPISPVAAALAPEPEATLIDEPVAEPATVETSARTPPKRKSVPKSKIAADQG